MVIWCEIQVLEGVMEFFGVSWKGSWNVRENGFRKSVDTLNTGNSEKMEESQGKMSKLSLKMHSFSDLLK